MRRDGERTKKRMKSEKDTEENTMREKSKKEDR